ncbi:HD domain-containing protein [Aestuariispira insulae]|uniref:Putative nucleotidyltransferase with HDIG domain n=1 Tax=Aestuariispira insulae TaxID=1461337 RepID=A0A3D9HI55_9PROT|nr:HD domain-containing phosphohydrolase [Aestuariispira insulae]RED49105.1 putative nucleotidyltransferase with HDIG domain [Aestuariispira insulae]
MHDADLTDAMDSPLLLSSLLIASPRQSLFKSVTPALSQDYRVFEIHDGWQALEEINRRHYSGILIDADLPGLSGFNLLKKVESGNRRRTPVIFLHNQEDRERAEACRDEGDCDLLLEAPFHAGDCLTLIWELADLEVERSWKQTLSPLQNKLLKVTKTNLKRIFSEAGAKGAIEPDLAINAGKLVVDGAKTETLGPILDGLKMHHSYTLVHSLKVASLMTIFGVHVGMNQHDLELLAQGGLLHDIGKSQTPQHLLSKPGQLDPDEWGEMQKHVPLSGEILRNTPGIDPCIVNIAEHHHEKMDGSGYPHGLTGAQMDDPSLVACIMDIYSALTDKRSYKRPFTPQESLEIMREMSGHHLEPNCLKKFEDMIRSGAGGEM